MRTRQPARPRRPIGGDGRPDNTRERLLTLAEELFARKGFAGTSVRELGAALGIANASILYHFPAKKKLYAAVLSRIADSIAAVVADLPAERGDATAQIQAMVERFMAWAYAHNGYVQIIVRELMENPDRLPGARHWHLAGVVEALRRPIDQARAEGRLPGVDPALFLFHLVGSISYFAIAMPTVSRLTGNDDLADLRQRYRETVQRVIAACLTRGE